jgi:hypothetical protein
MRSRERILSSLENVYRDAFQQAEAAGDRARMARLDFEFQQEQLRMEVLLDIRALLDPAAAPGGGGEPQAKDPVDTATAFLEKAEKIRRITRLR